MQERHPYCAGIDVHKKSVTVCVLLGEGTEPIRKKREFGTMTADLLELADWLEQEGVRSVVMESTGVYWKPIWAILAGRFELTLANAAFVKNMPGEKTDRKDAGWLAELHRHGLVRASYVPELQIQDLRELTRYRAQVTADRARLSNRIQKLLEAANIKLGSVATDVMGVSGQRILEAIIEGESDAGKLADQAVSHLRKKLPELERALNGNIREHHREMLRLELAQWRFLDRLVAEIEERIEKALRPFAEQMELLQTIPGVSETTAGILIAELGTDMSAFPTRAQVCSWAGLCPGHNESGGKRFSGQIREGNGWLKRALCQSAWAAARSKDSYLQAQFRRLSAKKGKKRALVAVAHSLLAIAYTLLKTGHRYQDLGADYFHHQNQDKYKRSYLRGLQRLGYKVTLEPAAA
jgi:transposase